MRLVSYALLALSALSLSGCLDSYDESVCAAERFSDPELVGAFRTQSRESVTITEVSKGRYDMVMNGKSQGAFTVCLSGGEKILEMELPPKSNRFEIDTYRFVATTYSWGSWQETKVDGAPFKFRELKTILRTFDPARLSALGVPFVKNTLDEARGIHALKIENSNLADPSIILRALKPDLEKDLSSPLVYQWQQL